MSADTSCDAAHKQRCGFVQWQGHRQVKVVKMQYVNMWSWLITIEAAKQFVTWASKTLVRDMSMKSNQLRGCHSPKAQVFCYCDGRGWLIRGCHVPFDSNSTMEWWWPSWLATADGLAFPMVWSQVLKWAPMYSRKCVWRSLYFFKSWAKDPASSQILASKMSLNNGSYLSIKSQTALLECICIEPSSEGRFACWAIKERRICRPATTFSSEEVGVYSCLDTIQDKTTVLQ